MVTKPRMTSKELSELSYYRTGGSCLGVFAPRSVEELRETIEWLNLEKKPYFVLGGGTNSLVSDSDFDGYAICFEQMQALESDVSREIIFAEAGSDNSDISQLAYDSGLGDLSWMYRLPGQIGGTVRMNARCYGGEISKYVSKLTTVTLDGKVVVYDKPGSLFRGYKDTALMDSGEIVASVELSLKRADKSELKSIREKMSFCEEDRKGKGQFKYPTCGCVFKNNYDPSVSVSSGFLLEKSGAKELSFGGAKVSPGHANFIYNISATSSDILELSLMMREKVYEKFGVWLEYEMELLGEIPEAYKERVHEVRLFDSSPEKKKALSEVREQFRKKFS